MKISRLKIADVISKRTIGGSITAKDSKEIAAYLLETGRTSELDSILRDVKQDWADGNVIDVVATSAFPISKKIGEDIRKEIMKLYPDAQKVIITERIDSDVIGGVKLEVANRQLDLSIENKLNKFKQLAVSERIN